MAGADSGRRPAAGLAARLVRPGSWPVRWRLALASAALTLAILLVFAAVIGKLATNRISDDFDQELKGAVKVLAGELRIVETPTGTYLTRGPNLGDYALPNDATVWVFDYQQRVMDSSTGARYLGPPHVGLADRDGLRVATAAVAGPSGRVAGYVQYARSEENVDSTIERLWVFLAAGVLGGTLLASLAGLAVADRAMRPIAALTTRAREIARTRDPSRSMPEPQTEDEVGELTLTLAQMLGSLDSAREEREDALRRQREFVADASHELRTPLTSVIANLELLQASLQRPETGEDSEMVDSALRSSRRMSRLVADLLLLARADAGRSSERSPCDLAEIAGKAALEVAPLTGDRSLEIDNERRIEVEGNPDELHRLVLNLLDNAARHTPPGTRISLSLGEDGARGIAWLEVADDGPGVPAEQREEVFDRFVRGRGPADTVAGPGSGLGLAIVRAVARSHGGSVSLTEAPGGGARFTVELPLAKTSEPLSGSLGAL
ncbi:MAG: HAMP domain-containing sensor histidine kinase [Solirubrobacterales bacterium]